MPDDNAKPDPKNTPPRPQDPPPPPPRLPEASDWFEKGGKTSDEDKRR